MQKEACLNYCRQQGITVQQVFIEEGESAKTADRTQFIKAIDYCKHAKGTVDYFIVWKIDRFARHTSDHFRVKTLLAKYGVSIRSVTETIGEDPQGHLMETILAGFAQFDNDIRAVRSRNGMEERLRQGIWVWRAPLGYYRKEKGANLSIDPKTAPMIKAAFEAYATGGYTYQSLTDYLKKRGFKLPSGSAPYKQLLEKVLRNPIYCGIIRVWDAEHKASFEPIIDEQLFNRCQSGYRNRIKNAPRNIKNPKFPLRRLVVCDACRVPLTASTSTGRSGKRYSYYHHQKQDCPKASFIPRDAFEKQFVRYLRQLSPTLKYEKAFKAIALDIWRNNRQIIAAAQRTQRTERDKLVKERQRIFDAHRAGLYSDVEFLEQKAVINRRVSQLEIDSLPDAQDNDDFSLEQALDFCFDFARDAAAQWQRLDYSGKVRFQKLIFNGNIPFDGDNFGTAQLSPIFALSEAQAASTSNLVTPIRSGWNQYIMELEKWQAFAEQVGIPKPYLRLAA
jgi:DNA invertase Pin-like site-specific DNA recombinase